jgi:hypothetical protein
MEEYNKLHRHHTDHARKESKEIKPRKESKPKSVPKEKAAPVKAVKK